LKSQISVSGEVLIYLDGRQISVYSNLFTSYGKNFLRDALMNSSTNPVSKMVLLHSNGSDTVSVSSSAIGIGECKFTGYWGSLPVFKSIYRFFLRNEEDIISKVDVSPFDKPEGSEVTVEWIVRIT